MKEINDIMKEFDSVIDGVLNSTISNTNKLLRRSQTAFQAGICCDYCGKSHVYNNMDAVQYDNNKPAKSAALVNSLAGFSPDAKKIKELTEEFHKKDATEKQKIEIQRQVIHEQNNYPKINFICSECAVDIQNLFRYVLHLYSKKQIKGEVDRCLMEGVTVEEKQALSACLTKSVDIGRSQQPRKGDIK